MTKAIALRFVNPADEVLFEKQMVVHPKDILLIQVPDTLDMGSIDHMLKTFERVLHGETFGAIAIPESIKLRVMTITDKEEQQ